mgnify:CR=1 FL=1
MKIESQIEKISSFQHLELLANQVVEGFITGLHKSPFHGFSVEFAEHRLYNQGDSVKNIDWKQHYRAVIERVFERGTDIEKNELIRFYGIKKVKQAILELNELIEAQNHQTKTA